MAFGIFSNNSLKKVRNDDQSRITKWKNAVLRQSYIEKCNVIDSVVQSLYRNISTDSEWICSVRRQGRVLLITVSFVYISTWIWCIFEIVNFLDNIKIQLFDIDKLPIISEVEKVSQCSVWILVCLSVLINVDAIPLINLIHHV